MSFKLSTNSIKNMEGIDPRLIEIANRAILISVVDFGIPSSGGKRTRTQQQLLFNKGKSKADGVKKLSYHQSGNALDFYAYVNGKASWNEHHLAMVATAFLQAAAELGYQLEWGGLWKRRTPKLINGISHGWDMPHVQLKRKIL